MKYKEDKKPGQHEELLAGQARIEELLKKPPQLINIEVRCSCCAETQREILAIVKDIRKHQGGLSEAEEAKQAAKLEAAAGRLSDAVDENL